MTSSFVGTKERERETERNVKPLEIFYFTLPRHTKKVKKFTFIN